MPITHASKVTTGYKMSSIDDKLHTALHAYWRQKTALLFGQRHLNNLGPGVVMGNELLQRIIDCARAHKLDSVDTLVRETKWVRAQELGEDVLRLVSEYVSQIPGLFTDNNAFP